MLYIFTAASKTYLESRKISRSYLEEPWMQTFIWNEPSKLEMEQLQQNRC